MLSISEYSECMRCSRKEKLTEMMNLNEGQSDYKDGCYIEKYRLNLIGSGQLRAP